METVVLVTATKRKVLNNTMASQTMKRGGKLWNEPNIEFLLAKSMSIS